MAGNLQGQEVIRFGCSRIPLQTSSSWSGSDLSKSWFASKAFPSAGFIQSSRDTQIVLRLGAAIKLIHLFFFFFPHEKAVLTSKKHMMLNWGLLRGKNEVFITKHHAIRTETICRLKGGSFQSVQP